MEILVDKQIKEVGKREERGDALIYPQACALIEAKHGTFTGYCLCRDPSGPAGDVLLQIQMLRKTAKNGTGTAPCCPLGLPAKEK